MNNHWICLEDFTTVLCVRFGLDYENFDEALAKLRQTGCVCEYQNHFERLPAMMHNWPESALVGSYIGGLKDEIRTTVKLFQPTSLQHAISLARLQEDKLQRLRRPLARLALLPTPSARSPLASTSVAQVPSNTYFKRLTWNEMLARHKKGLCYIVLLHYLFYNSLLLLD